MLSIHSNSTNKVALLKISVIKIIGFKSSAFKTYYLY